MSEPSDFAEAWIETEDGRNLPLKGNCRIGRKPDSDVVINGPKVSRTHAIIHAQDAEFWLIDRGSTNGTFLNSQRVLRPTRLRDGDRLTITGAVFRFRQMDGARSGMTTMGAGKATVLDIADREVWLLIVDIESFVELSRALPSEQLAVSMGTWFRTGQELVEKSGGRISKFLGDGFLACWEPVNEKTGALVETLRGLHELREKGSVKFRVAVHRGAVVFGGAVQFGEESMIGPEMNYIFRLENLAAELGVTFCVSEAAAAGLGSHLSLEPVPGDHELKGFPDRHRCFRIHWPPAP